MNLSESFRIAIDSLLINRLRAVLTALGIIIGVGAVIGLVSLGRGVEGFVQSEFQSLGANVLFVFSSAPTSGTRTTIQPISTREGEALASSSVAPSIRQVAMEFTVPALVVAGSNAVSLAVSAVTPNFVDVRSWYPYLGSFISQENVDTAARVAVLGTTVVEKLFGDKTFDPVGQVVRINERVFTVVGVMTEQGGGMLGSDIDLKHDFDFKDQDRFRIDGYWRFFKRHKLRFMYFDSSQGTDRTLSRNFNFGDTVFPINASARLDFKTQIIEGAYEYSFVRTGKFELASSIGLHNIHISTDLSAVLATTAGSGGFNKSSSASTNGPLPVIGLHFIWALNPKMYFDGYAQYFRVNVNDYDGSLSDYKFDFVWQPWKHFGMGAGYNHFTTRVDVAQDNFSGRLKFGYGGPVVFLTTAF